MALKLSRVTDHGIGYIVLCLFCFVFMKSSPKLRHYRPLDEALTSFLAGTVCTEKAQSYLSHTCNQQRSKRRDEKDGPIGLNKSQLFA